MVQNNNAFKLGLQFDPIPLIKELDSIPDEYWSPVFSNYSAAFWKGVAFRSADGKPTNLSVGKSYYDTPLMNKLVAFKEVIKTFECVLKRVRLLKLNPGGVLGKHRDIMPGEQISEIRLQIPVITNNDAIFFIEDVPFNIQPGETWYFDISREHSVQNLGTTPRTHLIIDCEINTWIKDHIPFLTTNLIV